MHIHERTHIHKHTPTHTHIQKYKHAHTGAIQSICYQEAGRAAVCALEGMQSLLALLVSPNSKVCVCALANVHACVQFVV